MEGIAAVMENVVLETAMGKSSRPDPRMDYQTFPRDVLVEFKTRATAQGWLEMERILAGPLGFYMVTRWGFAHPKSSVRSACAFLVDFANLSNSIRLRDWDKFAKRVDGYLSDGDEDATEAGHEKRATLVATVLDRQLPHSDQIFRPVQRSRVIMATLDVDSLLKKHVLDFTDGDEFPVREPRELTRIMSEAGADGKLEQLALVETLVIRFVTSSGFDDEENDDYWEYLRYMKILLEVTPHEDWFASFRTMGRGGFGLVRGCRTLTTGRMYAMKEMEMRRIKARNSERLCINEHHCLTLLDAQTRRSPFCVSLKYAFKSETHLVLIMDLMMGGDLSYHINSRRKKERKAFPEDWAMFYAARTVLGIDAIHSLGMIYRDLKPENVLIDDDGRSRISDMGLSCYARKGLRGMAGTYGYCAPEMFSDFSIDFDGYDQTVDWFSLGCMIWDMVGKKTPFRSKAALNFGKQEVMSSRSNYRLLEPTSSLRTMSMGAQPSTIYQTTNNATTGFGTNTRGASFSAKTQPVAGVDVPPAKNECMAAACRFMPLKFPESFSPSLVDLLSGLLERDPRKRLGRRSSREILSHPWFASLDMDLIRADTFVTTVPRAFEAPPIVPGKGLSINDKDVVGDFKDIPDLEKVQVSETDFPAAQWNFTSSKAFQSEVVWILSYTAADPENRRHIDALLAPERQKRKDSTICNLV